MTRLAQDVCIYRDGVVVDGVQFPWHIPRDSPPTVHPGGPDGLTVVSVDFYVSRSVIVFDDPMPT